MSTRYPSGRASWVEMAAGLVLWVMVLLAPASAAPSAAKRVLFPTALHITRELSDPVSQKTTVIDEYCHGNRVVSVSGRRTGIADYAKGELTEIDFAAGTYSITKFEQIARAYEKNAPRTDHNEWHVQSFDPQQTLSRGAAEALMGLGYPYRADPAADVVLDQLRTHERGISTNSLTEEYRLPLEHVLRVEVDGETIETRNVVKRLGHELPPLNVLTIPPGAKLVESRAVALQRLLEELDRPH
ncbi:MAG: hypothetical protein ACJ74H_14755 [Thermoanaerobaculia bacterium]